MEAETILQYFADYGSIAVFVIVLLEYLNLPGFPAGIIMPLAGFCAAQGNLSFLGTMTVSVAAGLTGSIILYWLGRAGGGLFLEKYYRRFPKQREKIEEKIDYLRRKGGIGVFVSKLLPMVRTLISIPAGVIKMNFGKYVISSVCGVAVWNLFFVGAGYFFGESILTMLGGAV
ncbi:MAG: DedA family protein [Lachnospiraceae bacterium]|nr:DedA family protein [Lachnospiraceae bacterium]